MSKIKIMTDSASDISVADEKQYSISILPFQVSLGGKDYLSRVDFDNEGFYKLMVENDDIPKTSQITPYQFVEIYQKEAEEGVTDLVLVLINSKGSNTFSNSVTAVNMFYEEHPQYKDVFKVHNFDGMGYNANYGEPVVQAAKMNQNGASVEEICNYLTETIPQMQIYFGIYDLKYAAKSGRIPSAKAFVGSLLNIKPVMKIHGGQITTAAKCMGEKLLVKKVAELAINDMVPNTPYQLIYGNDSTCLDELHAIMVEKLGYEPTNSYQIGAAVAANAGPKVCGVNFYKKPVQNTENN